MGLGVKVETRGGVIDLHNLGHRLVERAPHDRLQILSAGDQRQSPDEVGRRQGADRRIAQARAVQPVDLATDPGADDDVVERAGHGQALVQAVAVLTADQGRLGLDAEPVEQGQQQGGLGLAVTIAAAPGVVGGGGAIAAAVEGDQEIAHLVLDQSEGGGGLHNGVGAGGLDPR
jgi:hypothetical protein